MIHRPERMNAPAGTMNQGSGRAPQVSHIPWGPGMERICIGCVKYQDHRRPCLALASNRRAGRQQLVLAARHR